MSEISFNDLDVSGLSLTHSQAGVWHADVSLVPSADVPTGAATIDILGTTYQGTVLRADTSRGVPMARVVGGAGGLGTVLAPKAYKGVDAKLALNELLAAAGEALSSTVTTTALSTYLPFWIRKQARAGEALASLLSAVGIPAWRMLADGTLWVGAETWPASALVDFEVLVQDPHLGHYEVYAEAPTVFPGEVWDGKQVSVVNHRFTSSRLVTSLWVNV